LTAQQTNYSTLISMLGPLTNGLGAGGGSQTPWAQNIDAANFGLSNLSYISTTGTMSIATISATNFYINSITNAFGFLDSTGKLVGTNNGSTLTNLTAANITGTLSDAQIPDDITITYAANAGQAQTGDSATSFFSSGTLEQTLYPIALTNNDTRAVRLTSSVATPTLYAVTLDNTNTSATLITNSGVTLTLESGAVKVGTGNNFQVGGIQISFWSDLTNYFPSLTTDAELANATNNLNGSAVTVGTVADARIASTITRDTEWDTIAEIVTATGSDIVTNNRSGTLTIGKLIANGQMESYGAVSINTNTWVTNTTISMINGATAVLSANTACGIPGIVTQLPSMETYASLTIKAVGDVTFTNTPGIKFSDMATSRVITNGNFCRIDFVLTPGLVTNAFISQTR
jgi:hypothetical protein